MIITPISAIVNLHIYKYNRRGAFCGSSFFVYFYKSSNSALWLCVCPCVLTVLCSAMRYACTSARSTGFCVISLPIIRKHTSQVSPKTNDREWCHLGLYNVVRVRVHITEGFYPPCNTVSSFVVVFVLSSSHQLVDWLEFCLLFSVHSHRRNNGSLLLVTVINTTLWH